MISLMKPKRNPTRMRNRRRRMARKSRFAEYAKHVAKEQAERPASSVKTAKSVLGRLSQMQDKVKNAKPGTEVTA